MSMKICISKIYIDILRFSNLPNGFFKIFKFFSIFILFLIQFSLVIFTLRFRYFWTNFS